MALQVSLKLLIYIESQDKHYKDRISRWRTLRPQAVTEESDLGGFLIDTSKVGYGKSCQQVKAIAVQDS